jgi:asparagine synthase (glutamine-hydrolysing)
LVARRLSIIDEFGGAQPKFSDDKRVAMVFNGEIYNYLELKNELADKRFHTTSDTEVLLRLYERYGTECFQHARGMFALAVWDDHRKILLLARDRFGKKPLYYYFCSDFLVFASEIKAILENSHVPRRLSRRGLDHYLSWLAVPDPDSMFDRIHKLPPGHFVEINTAGNRNLQRYWQLSFPEVCLPVNEKEAPDLLTEKLDEAIDLRFRADVPVGILLSGGLDSSSLVALAAQRTARRLKTFSVGFDVPGYDEFKYSRKVASLYDTDHTEVVMPAGLYWELLQDVVWHLDEPMADTASVALYYLCVKARQSVKVLLSGEGSDEMLAGYVDRYVSGYRLFKGMAFWGQHLPARLRRVLWDRFGSRSWPSSRVGLWRLTQPLEYQFLKESIYGYYAGLRESLYAGGPLEGYQSDDSDLLYAVQNNGKTPLDRMLYVDTNVNLPAYLLMKADKMSMAASVELRCPFLDHVYAEFCASLPTSFKLNRTRMEGKRLLKEAMRPHLPPEIIDRAKAGFPVPINEWLRNELKPNVREVLFSSKSGVSRFLNMRHIQNMWEAHQEGRQVFGMQLWLLVLLELWLKRFRVEL